MIVDTAFGKNDIRGIYGKDVQEADATDIP